MESLIIPKFNQVENLNWEKKMCYSPTANFGDDFNIIIRGIMEQKNVHENSMMEGSRERQLTGNGHIKYNCVNKQKCNSMTTKNSMGNKNDIADKPELGAKSEGGYEHDEITKERKDEDKESNKDKKNKIKEKKKKWKPMPMEKLGFNLSLFPRPVSDNFKTSENDRRLFEEIEEEYEKFEAKCEPFEKLQEFEGCVSGNDKYLRADRDRKVRKVHKEIKNKYCRNVKNNKGRKTLYIHHRLSKLITLDVQSMSYLPCSTKRRGLDLDKNNVPNRPVYTKYSVPARATKPQCLAFAIDNNNVPSDIDNQIANLLINMQHRDLTPEDYDLLLRLDDRVKPKTLDETTLTKFKTDKVENNDNCEVCPICMELYQIGQVRKYLPCNHIFHCECIEMWLKNSSMNCPIDNLPIEPS